MLLKEGKYIAIEDIDYFIAVACTKATVDLIRGVEQNAGGNVRPQVHDNFACCNRRIWLNLGIIFNCEPRT